MVTIGNIEILCGALANEAALEKEQSGIFTQKLLQVLAKHHEPPLLTLPFDLAAWHQALPLNLLTPEVQILERRGVLGEHHDERRPPSQTPRV